MIKSLFSIYELIFLVSIITNGRTLITLIKDSTWRFNLFQIEQISQLVSFVESALNYHKQSADELQILLDKLRQRLAILLVVMNWIIFLSPQSWRGLYVNAAMVSLLQLYQKKSFGK